MLRKSSRRTGGDGKYVQELKADTSPPQGVATVFDTPAASRDQLQSGQLTERVLGADSKSAPRCFINRIIKPVEYLAKDKFKELSRLPK